FLQSEIEPVALAPRLALSILSSSPAHRGCPLPKSPPNLRLASPFADRCRTPLARLRLPAGSASTTAAAAPLSCPSGRGSRTLAHRRCIGQSQMRLVSRLCARPSVARLTKSGKEPRCKAANWPRSTRKPCSPFARQKPPAPRDLLLEVIFPFPARPVTPIPIQSMLAK